MPQEKSNSNTILSEIELIDRSQKFILIIVVGIALSYAATTIQKRQLCCEINPFAFDNCNCLPEIFPIRLISNALILAALIYFFIQSNNALCEPHDTCIEAKSASYNNTAALLVLIASAIRLIDLIEVQFHTT